MTTNIMTKENIMTNLKDYMFTHDNLSILTKHMITFNKPIQKKLFLELEKPIEKPIEKPMVPPIKQKFPLKKETIYKPKQKDSLFWCFYILKHGYFNYEMEINNQYFVVEKTEKFKYIDLIRNNKDILKIHKIKSIIELENDLANKDKITVKTFFALCVLENINILLVDKRKIFELICVDIDDKHPVNVIHRNNKSSEHYIELDVTANMLEHYRETYYKMSSFDSILKSMGSYKVDELTNLCNKLNININKKDDNLNNNSKIKKITKKDMYELLIINY